VGSATTRTADGGGPRASFWILIMGLNMLVLAAAAYQGIIRRPGRRGATS